MHQNIPTYTLQNGVKIPCIGFGTWQATEGDVAYHAVKEAIAAGYRHIDTAQCYGNEASVGRAIKDCGIPREELFITTKIWNDKHSYELTMSSFEESMAKLGLEYVDLLLIHWPNPIYYRDCWQEANAQTWKAMEELYLAKKVRAIGISNFRPHHIDELLKTAQITPMVNQIRLCPGNTQDEVVEYCKKKKILLQAYSPLGLGQVFEVEQMKEMAKKYNRSIAQICIRWSLQLGFLPLPKSVTPSRMAENLAVFDFELSPEDVRFIANLIGCAGSEADPDHADF